MKLHTLLFAVASAGLVTWLSGFASQQLVNPAEIKEDAVKIEVAAAAPAPAPTEAEVADVPAPEPAAVTTAAPDIADVVADAAPAVAAEPVSATAAGGFEPALALVATADVAKGEKLAKACAACHTFDKGGKNGVGPNLYGTVGRTKQTHEGFKFSGKLNTKGGEVWTYNELSHYLNKPAAYAPGTKMTYAGLKKAEDRAAVIAYLRTLADTPAELPTEAEIAAESTTE